MNPDHISSLIMDKFEQSKGSLSVNQYGSILKIIMNCVSTYQLTLNNPKALSSYMQLLNASLKHSLPCIRQSAEGLYVALNEIHGETLNQ